MAGKNKYHQLDDIGVVGVQSGVSKVQLKKEMDRTSQFFKILKKSTAKVVRIGGARKLKKRS